MLEMQTKSVQIRKRTIHRRRRTAYAPFGDQLESRQLLSIDFAPPSLDVKVGIGIADIATGNFLGNGVRDIVAVAPASGGSNIEAFVFRIPNNGNGTYGDPIPVSLPPNPQEIVVADFNNDGYDDLATSNGPFEGYIDVALGNGDGSFQPPVAYTVPGGTGSAIAAADLNKDGNVDLVVGMGNYSLAILFNAGDGTFGAPASAQASSPTTIASADFNNDGRTDLTYGQYFVSSVAVNLNAGGGSFPDPPTLYSTPNLVSEVSVGDFNGDGHPDIVAVAGTTLNVLLNQGNGTFATAISRPLTSASREITVGDFDGDGNLDVALSAIGPVQVLPGLGDGYFGTTLLFDNTAAYESCITAADMTGSGRLDLVYGVYGDGGRVRVMLNDSPIPAAGLLGFSAPVVTAIEGGGAATIRVDRTGGSSGAVSVHYATSAGTATNGVQYQDVSGTLNFSNGETSKTFSVPILDGGQSGTPSFVTVNLNLSQVSGGAVLGSSASAVLRISQTVAPNLGVNDVTVNQYATQAVFTVNSSFPIAQAISVHFATVDGTAKAGIDYTAVSTTVTFAPGETTKSVAVPILFNPLAKANTTFYVQLSNATNSLIGAGQGTGTILLVAATPLIVQGATVTAVQNVPNSAIVGSFSDPNTSSTPVTYSATIDWGDGSRPSLGTVVRLGNLYTVQGSHLYTSSGTFAITALVMRNDAPNLIFAHAVVGPNVIMIDVPQAFSPTAGTQIINTAIAFFKDTSGGGPAGSYITTIDWGDGTPSSLGFVLATGSVPAITLDRINFNTYAIKGTHTYAAPGFYALSVTVRGQNGAVSSNAATIFVQDSDGPSVTGITFDRVHARIGVKLKPTSAALDLLTVANSANYVLTKKGGFTGDFVVTGLSVSPLAADGSLTVTLTINGGKKKLPPGIYLLKIVAGGITDQRGVALDGEYYGSLPSGNGKPGGNFVARFTAYHNVVKAPVPVNGYVGPIQKASPATSKSQTTTAKHRIPAGPASSKSHSQTRSVQRFGHPNR